MKVKRIEVKNFKAVQEQNIDLNGCSAIVTAGNDKGKTSLLRGLIDRFQGQKPEMIVTKNEEKGYQIMELTDGSKIEWKFTEKSEQFAYITKEGFKQTTGVLKTIGERYFGIKFDIDRFLNDTPKEQAKTVALLVGLDFTEIDNRYKIAFQERTDANRELKRLESLNYTEPEKIEKPDIDKLKSKLTNIRISNSKLKQDWEKKNEEHLRNIQEFNEIQKQKDQALKDNKQLSHEIMALIEGTIFEECFNKEKAKERFNKLPKVEEFKPLKNLPEPEYKSTDKIELQIDEANEKIRQYDAYERDLANYNQWKQDYKETEQNALKCDQNVKDIEAEKYTKIQEANIPKEFEFTSDGILYKSFPLNNKQVSSSGKYIAALKLGSMVLGELRTMHFDASFLDKNSLSEIENWAKENNLQLLIERPDFDAGNIKYELIEKFE